ncbi:Acg family FMN-binding oxidoreductase [Pseudovibrio sp. SPO723]|uniref:Acg family FMN-binding oxidoreductase n=1 Tax=Nesiotobacter zosterae TaxID=392721 RepID=UPI0029C1E595|nr:Tat pathway signal protein [Pseudovibrio sp. SPO723]MDX5593934.1 Tat pathway signal protein [Pseudovibrio sp. SPO723]
MAFTVGAMGLDAVIGGNLHEAAVREVWIPAEAASGGFPEKHRRLVQFALLAANGHNTQPWIFEVSQNTIFIRPDFSRRTPVVDPDDHHLYASLGCATENLRLAAESSGFAVEIKPHETGVLVHLEPAPARISPLFQAIPQRQCVRANYDGTQASNEVLEALQRAGQSDGVHMRLFTDKRELNALKELVIAGNSAQMGDPAFVKELKQWIRFNGAHADRLRDGLYAGSTGSPSVPAWIGSRLFDFAFRKASENTKYAGHVDSSAGMAVIIAERDDPIGWIEAGRACQRFGLEATLRGMKYAFLNQPIEVLSIRQEFQKFLGSDKRPNLLMRFGNGPSVPRSLRRRLDDVMRLV